MKRVHLRGIAAIALTGFAGAAAAHTGHGTESFFEGLVHPFGLDHLLAMVAVGLWSVYALPAGRAWMAPATFMAALAAGAALGSSGFTLPRLEVAIAGSVLIFGAMIVLATRRAPSGSGLWLVALAAGLHGLAHGAEAPAAAAFAGYAAGFLITTAVLHFGGMSVGLSVRRWFANRSAQIVCALGLACSGAGVVLISHL